mmetsp:Transcript_8516/g.20426  ORF Transcript_8516/g.20426 Transcript_8516/m.20426 type:complete len:215 (-) Transcript_8516:242-886(-)
MRAGLERPLHRLGPSDQLVQREGEQPERLVRVAAQQPAGERGEQGGPEELVEDARVRGELDAVGQVGLYGGLVLLDELGRRVGPARFDRAAHERLLRGGAARAAEGAGERRQRLRVEEPLGRYPVHPQLVEHLAVRQHRRSAAGERLESREAVGLRRGACDEDVRRPVERRQAVVGHVAEEGDWQGVRGGEVLQRLARGAVARDDNMRRPHAVE